MAADAALRAAVLRALRAGAATSVAGTAGSSGIALAFSAAASARVRHPASAVEVRAVLRLA